MLDALLDKKENHIGWAFRGDIPPNEFAEKTSLDPRKIFQGRFIRKGLTLVPHRRGSLYTYFSKVGELHRDPSAPIEFLPFSDVGTESVYFFEHETEIKVFINQEEVFRAGFQPQDASRTIPAWEAVVLALFRGKTVNKYGAAMKERLDRNE